MLFTFETSSNRASDIHARVSDGTGAQLATYCSKQNIMQTKVQRKFTCLYYRHNIFLLSRHLYEKTQQKPGNRRTVTVTLITSH